MIAVFALTAGGSYLVTNKMVDRGDSPQVQGKKTEKNNPSAGKSSKPLGTDTTNGSNAAQEHKKVIQNFVGTIQEVANVEEARGNDEIGEELDEIVSEEEGEAEETAEAIEEVEGQPGWKTLLLGPDYKNLGQLRSALAHNENTVRKLTQTAERVQGEDTSGAIQEQLRLLEQERERIASVITENESQFSILGWFTKLILGYTSEPVDTEGDLDTDSDDTTGGAESSPAGGASDDSDTTDTETSGSEPGDTEAIVTE